MISIRREALVFSLLLLVPAIVMGDDNVDCKPLLDKAIQALGGEEALSKLKAAAWKVKGKLNIMGNESEFESQTVAQGIDHYKTTFEGQFGENKFKAVTVFARDKGWRQFAGMSMPLDKMAIESERRNVALQILPIVVAPLKGKEYKLEKIADEKVNDKPAPGIKVTGPEGGYFKLYFDAESGLPVRQTAKVFNFTGEEVTQETNYSDYKKMGGIQKATKAVVKQNGVKLLEQEIIEFKPLDDVEADAFAEPK